MQRHRRVEAKPEAFGCLYRFLCRGRERSPQDVIASALVNREADMSHATGRETARGRTSRRSRHRLTATAVQMASTTPNGHAPCKKPYTDDDAQAHANSSTNLRPRSSSA